MYQFCENRVFLKKGQLGNFYKLKDALKWGKGHLKQGKCIIGFGGMDAPKTAI